MSKIHTLREFVNRRLMVAADEICGFFERTMIEYEEEGTRYKEVERQVLDVILKDNLHKADPTHQLHVSLCGDSVEVHPNQQHCEGKTGSPLGQEDTDPLQTLEEPWAHRGLKQLQVTEGEADSMMFSVSPTMPPSLCVKSERDQTQQSHLRHTRGVECKAHPFPCTSSDKMESDGDCYEVSEPTRYHQTLSSDCSVTENEGNNSDIYLTVSGGSQSSFITQTLSMSTEDGLYICSKCGKDFSPSALAREKPNSCSGCSEALNQIIVGVQEPLGEESSANSMEETSVQREKKRTRNVDNWKSNKRKRLRNMGQSYINSKNVVVPGRRLREKNCASCRYKCNLHFPESEREIIFQHFWGMGDSAKQKIFIINHVLKRDKKRKTTEKDSRRQNSIEYFLTSEGRQIRVCKEFFLKTLDVSGKFARAAFCRCPSLQ